MSLGPFLARRALFALFAVYLVVSITFGFVALTADPQIAVVAYGAAQGPPGEFYNQSEAAERVNEAVAAYKQAHNLDEPVEKRYVTWLVNIATFDWGESTKQNAPVADLVWRAVPKTAAYVVPALIFALLGGVAAGVYAAMRRNTMADHLVTSLGYVAYSLPNFWIAEFIVFLLVLLFAPEGAYAFEWLHESLPTEVRTVLLPSVILGASLFANQLRHARAESLEHLGQRFVKLLRARGADDRRVARHVVRNASVPLLSLFVAELLTVLVVNIYVLEAVFNIDGLGTLSLTAIRRRDLPVVLGTTMVLVFVGIVGNFLQDVAAVVLDPRVADDEA